MQIKEQDKKKIIALLVLSILIVGVWSRALPKRKKGIVPPSPPKKEKSAALSEVKVHPRGELRKLQEEKAAVKWGRNPFLKPGEEKEMSHISGLSLTGITWDEAEPLVVINGVVLTVHDAIGGYYIKEITSETVVLEQDGEQYVLRLSLEK
ncbi:MAG: hypothetical protein ABH845_01725 [Candidatus Omnitrophota bacterium]